MVVIGIVGFGTIWSGIGVSKFLRNMLLPSSGLNYVGWGFGWFYIYRSQGNCSIRHKERGGGKHIVIVKSGCLLLKFCFHPAMKRNIVPLKRVVFLPTILLACTKLHSLNPTQGSGWPSSLQSVYVTKQIPQPTHFNKEDRAASTWRTIYYLNPDDHNLCNFI
jgi:hypothetical protein